ASAYEKQKQLVAATEEMGRALNAARELYKTGRLAPSVMASLYANSARLQLDVENPNAALEDLSKATQVASRPEDYAERGRILFLLNRHQEAVAAYDAALAVQPAYTDAHLGRAEAFLEMKNLKEAARSCDHYLARPPASAGRKVLAYVYRMRGLIRAKLD